MFAFNIQRVQQEKTQNTKSSQGEIHFLLIKSLTSVVKFESNAILSFKTFIAKLLLIKSSSCKI